MKEAMYYESKEDLVSCKLCPHHCQLKLDQKGRCQVRQNKSGKLMSLNDGFLSAVNSDPIEKKPLYHFMPGTKTLSIGSYGCNFKCDYCQNYDISMETPRTSHYTSEDIVRLALSNELPSISYTYNEPTVFYEFMLRTAKLARENGLKNIMVTNGYISREPLEELLPYMDAMNIDLKTYDKDLYQSVCEGRLENVLETIQIASKSCHVEVTMLIVPRMNDSVEAMEVFLKTLSETCPHIILHLSRYFPRYKREDAPTSLALLDEMKRIGKKYFEHVYVGNV
ncbi:MAG: AmmeMemoRadiSam system radical SAM enzyme [Vallitaleaceae bacterium]|nr:AmmeMemoRadiSam system radical SAM enzyme [Vallitaleaceae bacterium]